MNLEKLGVKELSLNECSNVNGGSFLLICAGIGVGIAAGAAGFVIGYLICKYI